MIILYISYSIMYLYNDLVLFYPLFHCVKFIVYLRSFYFILYVRLPLPKMVCLPFTWKELKDLKPWLLIFLQIAVRLIMKNRYEKQIKTLKLYYCNNFLCDFDLSRDCKGYRLKKCTVWKSLYYSGLNYNYLFSLLL